MTRSAYRKDCGRERATVKPASKLTHPRTGTRLVFVDHVAGTTTLLCPGCGAKLVRCGGRIDLGHERRSA